MQTKAAIKKALATKGFGMGGAGGLNLREAQKIQTPWNTAGLSLLRCVNANSLRCDMLHNEEVPMRNLHREDHSSHRVGWLRAAVLGANDGLVSTASLILGVASANASAASILLAGSAGLAAGAMSMAAGEYVSVSSQADTESADLRRERKELAEQPALELNELAKIYEARGVKPETALTVARELTASNALKTHARDELGISELTAANPFQAALTSALTFSVGAALPLIVALISPVGNIIWTVVVSTIVFLAVLGATGAKVGGAPVLKATIRVTFWGAIAMAITAGVGYFFGVAA
jgi:vacuolar iron transporter family protein